MEQENTPAPAVTEGAVDLERLRRLRFPELTIEHVADLVAFAREFGLNVWANHVCGKLEPTPSGRPRMVPMVMIHGLVARAHATGLCGDIDEPRWDYYDGGEDGGRLRKCSVTVQRLVPGDTPKRVVGVAWWHEYYGGKGTMWDTKPHHMLAKCALAIALRWAFPESLGGLYCPEELDRPPGVRAGAGKSAAAAQPVADEDGRVIDTSTAQV